MSAERERACVLALGFFDGVHRGHAELIRRTRRKAAELNADSAVMTFDTHPDELVHGVSVPLINSAPTRAEMLRRDFGVDRVLFLHFTEETMRLPWREFADTIRMDFHAIYFVVGEDFRFGWRGEGCADKLRLYCEEHGLGCDVVPQVELDGVIVSSTHIRTLLAEGRVEEARRFLGHPHILMGVVQHGRHLGRRLGAPTVNLSFPEGVVQLRRGVYATRVLSPDGVRRLAVTNIGVRPTVCGDEEAEPVVESCILDYSGDLYGRAIAVEFFAFLRPEQKFDDMETLRAQILRDEQAAREFFMAHPLTERKGLLFHEDGAEETV